MMPSLAPSAPGLVVGLPFPPSVNRIWRKGRTPAGKHITYIDKKYKAWRNEADAMLMGKMPKQRVAGPFVAFITLDVRRRRKGADADNRIKVTLDYLQRIDLIDNDSLAETVSVTWGNAPSGCAVLIVPVPA